MQSKDYAVVFIGNSMCVQAGNSPGLWEYRRGYINARDNRTASIYWHRDLSTWNEVGYLISGETENPEIPTTLLWDNVTNTNNLVYRRGYNPSRYLLLATRGNPRDILAVSDPNLGFNPISLCRSFNGIPDSSGNGGYGTPLTGTIINEKFHTKFPNIGSGDICHLFPQEASYTFYEYPYLKKITYNLGTAVADFVALNPDIQFRYGNVWDWGHNGVWDDVCWLYPLIRVAKGQATGQQ